MDRVMHHMPKETRPRLDEVKSFKFEEIYEFVREHQEQEEGLNALSTDYSVVSRILANRDAEFVEEPLPVFDQGKGLPKAIVPGIIQLPVKEAPKVDPAVTDLIRRFDGLTLTVEQFDYLANSNLSMRRILSNHENYAKAYKHLVLRNKQLSEPLLERNDGSFQSIYPPIMNAQSNVGGARNPNQSTGPCKCCGELGHFISKCPHIQMLVDNGWVHTRMEMTDRGYKQARYYFGPFPTDKWGIFPGGGIAPRAYDDEVRAWIWQSIKERFSVSDTQLNSHIRTVLPSWFGSDGKPIASAQKPENGESHTVEADEEGEALSQQTMALWAAAIFLEGVSQTGEVYNAEPGSYAVETRSKGVRNAAETHRKANRPTEKKSPVPKMKSSRLQDQLIPTVEDREEDEILRHRPIVEISDERMEDVQVDPLREPFSTPSTLAKDCQSETSDHEEPLRSAIKVQKKAQPIAIPTMKDVAALARNTSPTVIAQAMLNQEVRGLRQVDLLATPAVAAVIARAMELARKPTVEFKESEKGSGETMSVEEPKESHCKELLREDIDLQRMFEWGSQSSSGETCMIGEKGGYAEVITREVLERLCPTLSRNQRKLFREAEANEVQDFQHYEIEDEEDGYNEERSKVTTRQRKQVERGRGRATRRIWPATAGLCR